MTAPQNINLRLIGRVSGRAFIFVMLFFSTATGQRALDRVGVRTQAADVAAIKKDVAEIKHHITGLIPDVAEIKSLADLQRAARETASNEANARSIALPSLR